MQEIADHELLAQYVRNQSEVAFAALVQRHVNLVYSAALRRVGNPHQAEEITQAVFITLTRKAQSLSRRIVLSGWLYQTARLTAANFLRAEIRRARRQQAAHMQSPLNEPETDEAWQQIAPLLDDAMGRLAEKDRNAVVLRFFDGKSLDEVGVALGVSEDAARMRVTRALQKLRRIFAKRSVTLTPMLIAGAVSANSIQAGPVGLVATVVATVVQGSAAPASTLALVKGVLKLMAWTKAKLAIAVGAGALLLAGSATKHIRVTLDTPPPEPVYQGMTLRQWIDATPRQSIVSHDDIMSYRRTALSAMGKPALSYLHWMITHPRRMLDGHSTAIDRLTQRLPLLQKLSRPPPDRANFENVVVAFGVIGPGARDNAPDLVRLWESRGNPKYDHYYGFPMTLAKIGDASPEILGALHRHFNSRDRLNRALCAFAALQLSPNDTEAIAVLRSELAAPDPDVHTRYNLLDTFWRFGTNDTRFLPEIRNLIDASVILRQEHQQMYQMMAARAAWQILNSPGPATALIQRLGTAAGKTGASREDVLLFFSTVLELAEVPEARELSMSILRELSNHLDASTARSVGDILDRLEAAARGRTSPAP
jgi:RNA polymerase sigma factor (sigma-70 family)